ncbi:FAD-dependent monooxygenase [Micromonospora sp. NPDC005173]|uniref:FAD-dependent monooxygenase n=1 Tax=Micromonospora sp. NPDC005173 TaxID=3157165 RepID=UPI0033B9802A
MLVVGCGPVGGVLAGLLGVHGTGVVVVDQNHEPYPRPRAATLDREVMRILGWVPGLAIGTWAVGVRRSRVVGPDHRPSPRSREARRRGAARRVRAGAAPRRAGHDHDGPAHRPNRAEPQSGECGLAAYRRCHAWRSSPVAAPSRPAWASPSQRYGRPPSRHRSAPAQRSGTYARRYRRPNRRPYRQPLGENWVRHRPAHPLRC